MAASRFVVRLTALCRPLASNRLLAAGAILALGAFVGPAAPPARAQVGPPDAFYHTGGALGPILVADDQILVARGLRIVALSRDPASLGAELGQSEPLAGLPLALERHGGRLLVATERKTLEVLDISDVAPRILQRIMVPESSAGLAIGGDRAYLVGEQRLVIVDLTAEPFQIETVNLGGVTRGRDGILPVERRLAVVGNRLFFSSVLSMHVVELRPGPRAVEIAAFRTESMTYDIVAVGERVFNLTRNGRGAGAPTELITVDARPDVVPRIIDRWIDPNPGTPHMCDLFAVDGHLGVSGGEGTYILDVGELAAVREVSALAAGADCYSGGRAASVGAGMVALVHWDRVGLSVLTDVVGPALSTGHAARDKHVEPLDASRQADVTWIPLAATVGSIAVSADTALVADGRRIRRLALDGAGKSHEVEVLDLAMGASALALGEGRLWAGTYDGLHVASLDGSPLALVDVELDAPTPPRVMALFAAGHLAYVATSGGQLHVVDASDMTAPRSLASLNLAPGDVDEILGHGTRIVARRALGFDVIDVADPTHPTLLGTYQDDRGSPSTAMATDGHTVWLRGGGTVLALDISDPETGFPVSEQSLGFLARALTWHDGVLFASDHYGRLTAFDTAIHGRLREVGSMTLPIDGEVIRVHGDTLVATHRRGGAVILPAPEIGTPTEPTAASPTAVPTEPPAAPRYELFLPILQGTDG